MANILSSLGRSGVFANNGANGGGTKVKSDMSALEIILDCVKIRDSMTEKFAKDYHVGVRDMRQMVNYAVVKYNRSARQEAYSKGPEGFIEIHLAQTKYAWERIRQKYG